MCVLYLLVSEVTITSPDDSYTPHVNKHADHLGKELRSIVRTDRMLRGRNHIGSQLQTDKYSENRHTVWLSPYSAINYNTVYFSVFTPHITIYVPTIFDIRTCTIARNMASAENMMNGNRQFRRSLFTPNSMSSTCVVLYTLIIYTLPLPSVVIQQWGIVRRVSPSSLLCNRVTAYHEAYSQRFRVWTFQWSVVGWQRCIGQPGRRDCISAYLAAYGCKHWLVGLVVHGILIPSVCCTVPCSWVIEFRRYSSVVRHCESPEQRCVPFKTSSFFIHPFPSAI